MPINPYHAYAPYVAPTVPYPFQQLYEQAKENNVAAQKGMIGADAIQTRDRVLPGQDSEAQSAFEQEYIQKADDLTQRYVSGQLPPQQFEYEATRLAFQKKNDLAFRDRLESYKAASMAQEALRKQMLEGKTPAGIDPTFSYTNSEWDTKSKGLYNGFPEAFTGYNTENLWQNIGDTAVPEVFTNEQGISYQRMVIPEGAIRERAQYIARAKASDAEGRGMANALRRSNPSKYSGSDYEVLYKHELENAASRRDEDIMQLPQSDPYQTSTRTTTPTDNDNPGGFTQGWITDSTSILGPLFSYEMSGEKEANLYGDQFADFTRAEYVYQNKVNSYSHITKDDKGNYINTKTGRPADPVDIQAKEGATLDLRIARENRHDVFTSVASQIPGVGVFKDENGKVTDIFDKEAESNRQREISMVSKVYDKAINPWSSLTESDLEVLGVDNPQEARELTARIKNDSEATGEAVEKYIPLYARPDLYRDTYYIHNSSTIKTGKHKGEKLFTPDGDGYAQTFATELFANKFSTPDDSGDTSRRWTIDKMPLNTKNPAAAELIKYLENARLDSGQWYDPEATVEKEKGTYSFPALKLPDEFKGTKVERKVQGIVLSPVDGTLMAEVDLIPIVKKGAQTVPDESQTKTAYVNIGDFGNRVLAEMDFGPNKEAIMNYANQIGYQQLYSYGTDGNIELSDGSLAPYEVMKDGKTFNVYNIRPGSGAVDYTSAKQVTGKFAVAKHYLEQESMARQVKDVSATISEPLVRTENGDWNGGRSASKDPDVATAYQFRRTWFEKDVKDKLGLTWDKFSSDPEAAGNYFNNHHLPDLIKYIDSNRDQIGAAVNKWNSNPRYSDVPMDKYTLIYLAHRLGKSGMVGFLQEATKKDARLINAKDGFNVFKDLQRFLQNSR